MDARPVVALVLARVDAARVQVFCRYGPPATVVEASTRLEEIDRNNRDLTRTGRQVRLLPWIMLGFAAAFTGIMAVIALAINNGWPALMGPGGFFQQALQQPQAGWQIAVPVITSLSAVHVFLLLILVLARPALHFAKAENEVLRAQLESWLAAQPIPSGNEGLAAQVQISIGRANGQRRSYG
jgi:hypothetical protein